MEFLVEKQRLNAAGTVRVSVEARDDYSLSIREGIAVFVPTDEQDPLQYWIKVDKFGEWMKDANGLPGFSLVNKATGLVIKHPVDEERPVQLVPYSPYYADETVMWTAAAEGDTAGYKAIRMINDVDLNLTVLFDDARRVNGNGVLISVWKWNDGGSQKWKFVAM